MGEFQESCQRIAESHDAAVPLRPIPQNEPDLRRGHPAQMALGPTPVSTADSQRVSSLARREPKPNPSPRGPHSVPACHLHCDYPSSVIAVPSRHVPFSSSTGYRTMNNLRPW